jgi:DNA mismatch repair ATPase MutS
VRAQDLEGMNSFQKQYWEIKKQHWDKIVFCRNGVFWGKKPVRPAV